MNEKGSRRIGFPLFLLLIIGALSYYIYMTTNSHKNEVLSIIKSCSPVGENDEIKLDINSTLATDLYKKVETNLREDLAETDLNNNMKIYLAYRQILEKDKYESNCNLFIDSTMEPFKCVETPEEKPKAFKEETLIREYKKLFGEQSNIQLENVQLKKSCVGGYAYLKERGEFVQGKCSSQNATTFSVDKKLIEAKSTGKTVVLKEEVQYHGNEKMYLPDELKSGYYYYTFKLDTNYNYILISKTYEAKH